jgi:hypothetical protein
MINWNLSQRYNDCLTELPYDPANPLPGI